MPTSPVISVQGLSKRYILGAMAGHDTLRDQLAHGTKALFRAFQGRSKRKVDGADSNAFWALKDVCFSLGEGEVLGVVGRNGAGKSTLLKLLSQITEPTEGEIRVRGRMASLLEVGTGFHPELTGRENVFLNGAILGMTRREIMARFDEIVAFAEVEKFLDTPVKRYSNGMYVRLAFAVAAHLDPEILVVDEVLAVGDVQFQKKCLGKMEDVSKRGRTVLFVSHNMSAVEMLCSRAILLDHGRLCMDDTARNVVKRYVEESHARPAGGQLDQRVDRTGTGAARVVAFRILNEAKEEEPSMQSGGNYIFAIEYDNHTNGPIEDVSMRIDIFDDHTALTLILKSDFTAQNVTLRKGKGTFYCAIKNLPLANGLYMVRFFLQARADTEMLDWVDDAVTLTVSGGDFFGTQNQGMPKYCKVLVKTDWSSD